MHSFEKVLRHACRSVKPKTILEWGPGRSTGIMLEECPDAILFSTEHNQSFGKIAREMYPKAQVFVLDATCPKSKYAAWTHECFDSDFRADLVFVDGRRRVECCMTAWMLLRVGGVLVLHDAHRWQYRRILEYWLGAPAKGEYASDSDTCAWEKTK